MSHIKNFIYASAIGIFGGLSIIMGVNFYSNSKFIQKKEELRFGYAELQNHIEKKIIDSLLNHDIEHYQDLEESIFSMPANLGSRIGEVRYAIDVLDSLGNDGLEDLVHNLQSKLEIAIDHKMVDQEKVDEIKKRVDSVKLDSESLYEIVKGFDVVKKSIDEFHDLEIIKPRTVSVGIGYDVFSKDKIKGMVLEANKLLIKHNLQIDVAEEVDMDLLFRYMGNNESYFNFGKPVYNSFEKKHDFYFVFCDAYRLRKNYVDRPMILNRIALVPIDIYIGDVSPFDHNSYGITSIVSHSIESLFFSNKEGQSFTKNWDDGIRSNLFERYYDVEIDFDIFEDLKREISVTVGLDDVTEDEAIDYVNHLNDVFSKRYGISFKIDQLINHMASFNEFPDESFENIREISQKVKGEASDLYIYFTDEYVESKGRTGTSYRSQTLGQAHGKKGYAWITNEAGMDKAKSTGIHETLHLLGIGHVYLKNAVMHPFSHSNPIYSSSTDRLVHFNKFKDWKNER